MPGRSVDNVEIGQLNSAVAANSIQRKKMVSDQELKELILQPESDRLERKESAGDLDVIKKNICAFANDLPDHRRASVLLIGVRDNGQVAGQVFDDQILQRIANVRDDIQPFSVMSVEKQHVSGGDVIVVQVESSLSPPVRFRGRTWVRVGPTLRSATQEEETRLSEKRRWKNLPYDHTPVTSASIADLDLDLFRNIYLLGAIDPEILRQNQRSVEQQLTSLRLLTGEGLPSVAGLLAIGKDVRQWLPGAYIQFVRFAGKELTDPVKDQKEINGPMPTLMRLLDETLAIHIETSSTIIGQSTESKHPDYPIDALRQLTRNAVMHRIYEATNAPVRIYWFNDRIEILSPGGPYGIVTKENFGQPDVTDYRNPLVAEVLKILGYVQHFGIGIALAKQQLKQNNSPLPEFTVETNYVLATVRSRS